MTPTAAEIPPEIRELLMPLAYKLQPVHKLSDEQKAKGRQR